MNKTEWKKTLQDMADCYVVPDFPATDEDKKNMTEFIIVYTNCTKDSNIIDPKLMLMEGALHVRQMVVDVEDYVAQQASRRLHSKITTDPQWDRLRAALAFETEDGNYAPTAIFYSWHDYKGFMRVADEPIKTLMDDCLRQVQQELNLDQYFGGIRAAKEQGNLVAHPVDLWDEALMTKTIDVLFPVSQKRDRPKNISLKRLYQLYKKTVFTDLIK
jgi:hypothetical protein